MNTLSPRERENLPQPVVIESSVFADERGHFTVAWHAVDTARSLDLDSGFVQDNQSRSHRGVLRGLHYQIDPRAQGKLVRAVRGAVFDVAVDIRRSSPTFGEWMGVELSEDNFKQLWVPRGFAHGFLALSDPADLLYKVTDYYSPEHDRAIRWDDPTIGIEWPIEGEPIVSDKDRDAPYLRDAETFA